jgi:hypothetical protein
MQQIMPPLLATGNGTKTTGAIHRNCNSPASMYAIQRIGEALLLSKHPIASLSLVESNTFLAVDTSKLY